MLYSLPSLASVGFACCSVIKLTGELVEVELAKLSEHEGLSFGEVFCRILIDRVMLLQNSRNEVDLLPEGGAMLKALCDLLMRETEFLHQALAISAATGIQACPSHHGVHKQADREAFVSFEGKLLDRILESDYVDVVALITEVAEHDTLENEPHPLLEAARIGAEKCQIEVKVVVLKQQRRNFVAKVEIKEREYARKQCN